MKTNKKPQSGQALIESALVLLVFLVTLLAIFDFSQFAYFNQAVTDRLRTGARYGAVHDCGIDPNACDAAVKMAVYNSLNSTSPVLAYLNDSGSPGWVSAKVNTQTFGTMTLAGIDQQITLTVHDYPISLLLFPVFHRTTSISAGLEWERCYSGCK